MSDPDRWLAGLRRQDLEVLGAVYDALSPALFRYACRLLGDSQEAEDVVSETFARLLKAIRNGGGPQSCLQGYLYRVAHNLAMDHHRAHPINSLDDLDQSPAVEDPDQIDEARHRQAAREALWRLTPEQRQVIILKFYQGLSNEVIAAALDKSVGTVKSLQHRALGSLHRMLAAQVHDLERVP